MGNADCTQAMLDKSSCDSIRPIICHLSRGNGGHIFCCKLRQGFISRPISALIRRIKQNFLFTAKQTSPQTGLAVLTVKIRLEVGAFSLICQIFRATCSLSQVNGVISIPIFITISIYYACSLYPCILIFVFVICF